MRATTVILPAGAAFLALVICGCMEEKLSSSWRDRDITIDGKNADWAGAEAYYDEERGIKIGLSNDDQYLYVYLATWHRRLQQQIIRDGLTIWFDRGGGKGKTFGIQYPLRKKMSPSEFPMGERGSRGGPPAGSREMPGVQGRAPGSPPSGDISGSDSKMLADMLTGARSILEIICPAEGAPRPVTLPDSSNLGIEAMIDIANRTLIYELRVPLQGAGQPCYAINAEPGRKIGIGFMTGKMEMPAFGRPEGGPPSGMGEPPGGTGGPPGGMGGSPGGERGGPGGMSRGSAMESLELWTKVSLAVKPGAIPK